MIVGRGIENILKSGGLKWSSLLLAPNESNMFCYSTNKKQDSLNCGKCLSIKLI